MENFSDQYKLMVQIFVVKLSKPCGISIYQCYSDFLCGFRIETIIETAKRKAITPRAIISGIL